MSDPDDLDRPLMAGSYDLGGGRMEIGDRWYDAFLPGCDAMTSPERNFEIHVHWGWFSKWRRNSIVLLVTDHWIERIPLAHLTTVAEYVDAIEARQMLRRLAIEESS